MLDNRASYVLVALLTVSACTGPRPGQSGSFDSNRITREQLANSNLDNLFQVIERLRPEWLNSRGPTSVTNATMTLPSVFMNGQHLGKPDLLRDMKVIDFSEIQFWPAGQAAARFGMGHPRGVIEIKR